MKYATLSPFPDMPVGWSVDKWRTVPGVYVEWDYLTLTQERLNTKELLGCCSDEPSYVIRYQGENYVEYGHHRLIKQFLSGEDCAYVRMLDLDA